MGTFNKEDKVKYSELAPSLQAILDAKALETDLEALANTVSTMNTNITKQIGSNRLTISSSAPSSPQNDEELWIDTTNNLPKRYSGTWIPLYAVYK